MRYAIRLPANNGLREKVAAEHGVATEVELVGLGEIATIAPAVSGRMIGAAWHPGEGKINALLTTPHDRRRRVCRRRALFRGRADHRAQRAGWRNHRAGRRARCLLVQCDRHLNMSRPRQAAERWTAR